MNISQWKNGDRTFFSLEVDDRLLLLLALVGTFSMIVKSSRTFVSSSIQGTVPAPGPDQRILRRERGALLVLRPDLHHPAARHRRARAAGVGLREAGHQLHLHQRRLLLPQPPSARPLLRVLEAEEQRALLLLGHERQAEAEAAPAGVQGRAAAAPRHRQDGDVLLQHAEAQEDLPSLGSADYHLPGHGLYIDGLVL